MGIGRVALQGGVPPGGEMHHPRLRGVGRFRIVQALVGLCGVGQGGGGNSMLGAKTVSVVQLSKVLSKAITRRRSAELGDGLWVTGYGLEGPRELRVMPHRNQMGQPSAICRPPRLFSGFLTDSRTKETCNHEIKEAPQ